MGERGRAVQCAIQVIRANDLTNEELELQLDAIWKSGYQAGRKAVRKIKRSETCNGQKY